VDGRGKYLGEFHSGDQILVMTKDGQFFQTSYDLANHYEDNILYIEKYDPEVVWSAVYYDADQDFYYLKRFQAEPVSKPQRFIGDNPKSHLVRLTHVDYPRLEIKFGGEDKDREKVIVEVAEFINIKGYKAKGKRLTTYQIHKIMELEPIIKDEPKPEDPEDEDPDSDEEEEDNSQMSIF
jgi:topoisomerase-4 subunit A